MVDEYVLRATADVGDLVDGASQAERAIDGVHEAGDRLGERLAAALKKPGEALPALGEKLSGFVKSISTSGASIEPPSSGITAATGEMQSALSAQQQLLADQKARLEELRRVYEILYNTMGTVPRSFGTLAEYRQHLVDIMNSADGTAASLRRAEDAAMKLDRVDDAMLALGEGNLDLATRFGFKQTGEDLKALEREIAATEQRLNEMAAAGQAAAAATSGLSSGGGLGGFLSGIGGMLSGAVSGLGRLASTALSAGQALGGTLLSGLRTGVSFLGRAGAAALGFAKNLLSIRPGAKHAEGGVNGLVKSLTSFSRLLITRFKRSIISGIFNGMKEGMSSLAQESAGVNGAISSMGSAFKTFTNQLIAALGPLIQLAGPIITQLLQGFTGVAEKVSAFTAALTGADTYKSALAVEYDYAAKSADKATKSAKKYQATVLGFDKLNKLGDKGSSESSGAKFQDVKVPDGIKSLADTLKGLFNLGDFSGLGAKIADGVNKAFEWLKNLTSWENVGGRIQEILGGLIDAFNGFIHGLDWGGIGETIGGAVNTILYSLQQLLTGIDWVGLGEGFATGVNGLVSTVDWHALGQVVMLGLMALAEIFDGFVSTVDWPGIGHAIHEALAGAIEAYDPELVGHSVSTLVNGIFTMLKEAIDPAQWAEAGKKIAETVNEAVRDINPATIAEGLSDLAKAILDGLTGFIVNLDTGAMVNAVLTFLQNVDWGGIISAAFRLLSAAIGSVMGAITTFVADLFAAIVNLITGAPAQFKTQLEACGGDVGKMLWNGLTGALAGIGKWIADNISKPFKQAFENSVKLPKLNFGDKQSNGKSAVIRGFASGGFPSTGQVFMARERGPELVGSIGGQTAVANNGQIVESIASGVRQAVTEAMLMAGGGNQTSEGEGGGDVVLYIDSEELARASLKGQRRLDKRSNPVIAFA